MKTLTRENFESEVLKSDNPVLVDFWAEWCAPCKAMAPVLEELSEEYGDKIKIAKLNVDEFSQIARQYHVSSIPNMKIFKNGQIVDDIIGIVAKDELIRRLDKIQ